MSLNTTDAKPTRYPGVYRLPDGGLLIRAAVRLPTGKVKSLRKVLPPGTRESEAVAMIEMLKDQIKDQAVAQSPAQQTPSPLLPGTATTLADYAESWLANRRDRLKPSTALTYANALGKHILPRLGHLPLDQINRAAVEGWVVWVQSRKDAGGQPYREVTMRQWWRSLKTLLADAAADHGHTNPVVRVRPPERPESTYVREQETLTLDETTALLEAAARDYPDRYAEIVCLALTGMRAGEAYALKWDAVNFQKGEAVIKRSISVGVLTESTKTKKHRTVPLHPVLLEALRDHRARMFATQHPGLASGLCFPSDNGKPRTPHTLDRPLEALCKTVGIELRLGAQVLRRSMNSNLLRLAVDRLTIRSIMGHTTEQMTQRYFGASDADKRGAVLNMVPMGIGSGDNRAGQAV